MSEKITTKTTPFERNSLRQSNRSSIEAKIRQGGNQWRFHKSSSRYCVGYFDYLPVYMAKNRRTRINPNKPFCKECVRQKSQVVGRVRMQFHCQWGNQTIQNFRDIRFQPLSHGDRFDRTIQHLEYSSKFNLSSHWAWTKFTSYLHSWAENAFLWRFWRQFGSL